MKNKLLILSIFLVILFVGMSLWYLNQSKIATNEILKESMAIETIKNQFPEFKEYPSDNLPLKSIKAEKADDGWYVAFVQEGSGRPIIEASCFFVKNDKSIMQRKYIPQDNALGEFSAKECRVIESGVGGDKDEHGCIGSAGFSWCEKKQKCLRVWEEPCEGNAGSVGCARENCHGLDIQCGFNPPDACTEMYEIGDKCLQYAKCGVLNGRCQQIQNTQFTDCKSCVQKCIDANEDDNSKLFECESKCN